MPADVACVGALTDKTRPLLGLIFPAAHARRLTRPFRRKIVRLSDVVKGEGTEDGVVRGYVTRVLR